MDEDLAGYWKEQLDNSITPHVTLHAMYKHLTQTDVDYYSTFGKLVKIYGRTLVYFAILDCSLMDNIEGDPLNLLSYFCKKRMEENITNTDQPIDIAKLREKIRIYSGKKDVVPPTSKSKAKKRTL